MTASSHFKTSLYFPVVDQFIVEMNERFNHSNSIVMKGITTCSPSSSAFLTFENMKPFSFIYGIDVVTLEIEVALFSKSFATLSNSIKTMTELGYLHSCLPAYQNLYDTVQIALTIAVTSAECERSFSSLKRIKTRLRTTMGEDCLSDLAILSIEKDIVSHILDYDEVITDFASADNNRRIVLS